MLRTIRFAYSWAKSSNTKKIFYNKVLLTISCDLLNIIKCEHKKQNVVWVQNVWKYLAVYPRGHMAAGELWLAATQHHERVLYYMSLAQEKIKIQNLRYSYC